MEEENKGLPTCPDCERLHTPDNFCPRRVARAATNPTTENIDALNDADRNGLMAYIQSGMNVETLLEIHLADL